MKTLSAIVREKIIGEIQNSAKKSQGCFFICFNKIPAFAVNTLRNNLRRAGTNVFVAKNTLIKKALEDIGVKELNGMLNGETGVVLVEKDVVETCKILADFTKENEALQLRGGFLGDRLISPKDMGALAKLPPREVMLGMAVGAMAAPLSGFVGVLNQIILKFVWTLEEIKKHKDA